MTALCITDIFKALKSAQSLGETSGLAVTSPVDGKTVATIAQDTLPSLSEKIAKAHHAQKLFAAQTRAERAALVERYAGALKAHRELLADIIHIEAGKTPKEAAGEVDAAADILLKTINDATLPELNGMLRRKERPPVGVVGLITSFNFPIAVAHWTCGPALLAGNAVVWKPSEKTPLTALACKAIFDSAAGAHNDLLQLAIGGREVGEILVAHEQVDMISATGSVAMGQGIKALLAKKRNHAAPPILELGGNNGAIISNALSDAQLEWSLGALMGSFLGTTGQRCTNTRRLIVHRDMLEKTVAILERSIGQFLSAHVTASLVNPENPYGYLALIDADAFTRFEQAKKQAAQEGGKLIFGKRLLEKQAPNGFVVEPALAVMPDQTAIMHKETFAPLLFIAPYAGDVAQAVAMLSAPDNAGLVGAIYTQSQREADVFAAHCDAGHALINPPKGTGTPAHGMGFGGNKHSGEGEILNSADPLQAFTRPGKFTRIAQNKEIKMDQA
jgi:aldehyde dehydrogenase (NAD+)